MDYKGIEVYDNDDFFKGFMDRRNREESPDNLMEKPVIDELLGDAGNKDILDLGCGDGQFGLELIRKGCHFYEGVDASEKMAKEAKRNLDGTASRIHHSSLESWEFPLDKYDLILSRMVIHYLEEVSPIFYKIHESLKSNGKFIFSVQHPFLTSSMGATIQEERRSNWIVDSYFSIGKRVEPWIGKHVVKYHRTIEDYFQTLLETGFKVEALKECSPRPEYFSLDREFERRKRIPLFLVFSCSI